MDKTGGPGKNLSTRFQPGWKGGPGRPKGSRSIVTLIKQALESDQLKGNATPDGRSVAQWFAECLISNAMAGNAAAINQVMDRVEGKVSAETSEASPAVFEIIDDGRNPPATEVPPSAGTAHLPE